MKVIDGLIKFYHMAVELPSLYLFFAYMAMIFLSGFWQNLTKPLGLRPILILHNFGCCLLSVASLGAFCFSLYENGSIYGKTPNTLLVNTFWLYWITKTVELLDTVFMILRHKKRQISFLHVYHHSSMLILSDMSRLLYPWPSIATFLAINSAVHVCLYLYYGLTALNPDNMLILSDMSRLLYPWPSIATFLAINSAVHVCLYLYYGLTALNPDNPPQWKKEMTQIQIIQFIIGFFIAGYGYWKHGFCMYSIFYGISMIVLFSNFYYQAYVKKRRLKPADKLN